MRTRHVLGIPLGFPALLAMTAALTVAVAGDPGESKGPYHPTIDPSNFSVVVNNPYFPLVPGTTRIFAEKDGEDTMQSTVTVTHDTKMIMGVKCVVVHDVITEEGEVQEDTYDWYAQDKKGAVWYFGEATREFKGRGRVSTEGSWEAGLNGQPGVIMPAHPVPGAPYRQEYSPDNAEDMGQVVALNESVTVPFGSFAGCVRTKEWSLLESGTEKKWYAKGVGVIRVESTGGEVMTLISVKHE
jgi:hypothetical protein